MVHHSTLFMVFVLCHTVLSFRTLVPKRVSPHRRVCPLSMISGELKAEIERSITSATGQKFVVENRSGGGGGGGGASVGTINDGKQHEYFYKIARGGSGYDMLSAEYNGVLEMYNTHTIRVPKPIVFGSCDYDAFVIFEKLSMGGGGNGERMGKELAQMHRHTSANGMYGWKMNNTIGATFQPNNWTPDWPTFWDEYRLGHMLTLARMDGASFPEEKQLRSKVKEILSQHQTVPSLVHGDLWSGNQAHCTNGDPVIYDPATYYGDREVDLAMTKLFGSNSNKFYEAYHAEWPLPPGYQQREVIYNLYHILNHFVLFGGGYLQQAHGMISRILTY